MDEKAKAKKAKLVPLVSKGCHVRICIQGVLGPEYLDGKFIRFYYKDSLLYEAPGGWRDTCAAHVNQVTEVNRTKV